MIREPGHVRQRENGELNRSLVGTVGSGFGRGSPSRWSGLRYPLRFEVCSGMRISWLDCYWLGRTAAVQSPLSMPVACVLVHKQLEQLSVHICALLIELGEKLDIENLDRNIISSRRIPAPSLVP